MDKRTLLFMICISLAFFGIQAWFSPGKGQEIEKRVEARKNSQGTGKRGASLSQDREGGRPAARGNLLKP